MRAHQIMTKPVVTVAPDATILEAANIMLGLHISGLPVVDAGMVTRANLIQAVASLARHIPDPTADDDHIRDRIIHAIEKADWRPSGLNVIVRDGIVHLSGVILEEEARHAAVVAAENVDGVVKVHDHLRWFDTSTGTYLNSPEDDELSKAG